MKLEGSEMKKKQIWIFVRGGLVTEVKSTDPNIKVNLIDYDNLESGGEDIREQELLALGEQELSSQGEFVIF